MPFASIAIGCARASVTLSAFGLERERTFCVLGYSTKVGAMCAVGPYDMQMVSCVFLYQYHQMTLVAEQKAFHFT